MHAVADTIRTFGETCAFSQLFPHATAVFVKLAGETWYDYIPSCAKRESLLRGIGTYRAFHSTSDGSLAKMALNLSNRELLGRNVARIPLRVACDELGIHCERLGRAERAVQG